MELGAIKVIAGLLILASLVKLLVVLISPKSWAALARRAYAKPLLANAVALVLALVVLYFLLGSGLTILEILACFALFALLMVPAVTPYIQRLLDWAEARDPTALFREQGVVIVIWCGLILWGLVELVSG
jgi:hypothetical protein